ncbi:hypothetical protein Pelo_18436 [Pelomyxa schiedti]|nr:hypothetical protein Pelo_18436 [Pelomyxa schiedti]
MLRIYVNKSKTNWDELLPLLAFAYRTTMSRTTGFSPFFLEHGRDCRTTGNIMAPPNLARPSHPEEMVERIRKVWGIAQHTAEIARQAWESKTASTATNPFKVGDLVYVLKYTKAHAHPTKGKPARKWKGPFRIVEVPFHSTAGDTGGCVNAKVSQHRNTGEESGSIPIVNTKVPESVPKADTPKENTQTSTPESNKGEYDVESILGSRVRRGKKQYLIHWKGFQGKDNSWEDKQNCVGCKQLIKEWKTKNQT